jgi:uncharacterized protein (TIGR00730 family)
MHHGTSKVNGPQHNPNSVCDTMIQSICVFCGSRHGDDPAFADVARELGRALVARKIRLVFGGGHIGLMGVVADAVLEQGGEVIGVIPEALVQRELAHPGVQDMRIVPTMHARKALMSELSDGFIALPGGLGTFEELFEVLTWGQLGFHNKPIALLNVNGYYDPLLTMLDRGVQNEFLSSRNRNLLFDSESVSKVISFLNGE